jgi:SAM-dependent methyltransferase
MKRERTRRRQLEDEIMRLAPWHLDVEATAGLSTAISRLPSTANEDASGARVSFISPRDYFSALVRRIYPRGLEGRTVLDAACNCGGYLFWARELGAGRCFGFDVREHWIDQARFLARVRGEPSDDVEFAVRDLYDLPHLNTQSFDVALFKGIFYHLPDPIRGLKIVAERTRELLLLNTATRVGLADGMLVVGEESTEALMSGVYGLSWYPSGPEVLRRILAWLGFPVTRISSYFGETPQQARGLGRIELLAARDERVFEHYDALSAAAGDGGAAHRAAVRSSELGSA